MSKKKYQFEHVTLINVGDTLPVVFRIDEGYRRGYGAKTAEGEYIAFIGVSNIKAKEATTNYKEQEHEEIVPVLGIVINSAKEAEVLGEFFTNMAKSMEKGDKE